VCLPPVAVLNLPCVSGLLRLALRRSGTGRNVTFPARQYSVNGERRSFALLRPITDTAAQDRIRDLILEEYAEFETAAA